MTEHIERRPSPRGGELLAPGKGQRSGGRKRGVPNKVTTALKEAILLAAEQVGQDGEGKNGLAGYLSTIARTQPKVFVGLLSKLLPCQVNDSPARPTFRSHEEVRAALRQRGIYIDRIFGE